MSLPIGNLTLADVIGIRRNGEFQALRDALRRGLQVVERESFSGYFDPK
jgi:hypothetical protein